MELEKIPHPERMKKYWRWTEEDDDALEYLYLQHFMDAESIAAAIHSKISASAINTRLDQLGLKARKFQFVTPDMDAYIRKESIYLGSTNEVSEHLGMSKHRLISYMKHINIVQINRSKKVQMILDDPTLSEQERKDKIKEIQKKKVAENAPEVGTIKYLFEIEVQNSNGEWEWYGCVEAYDDINFNRHHHDILLRAEQKARTDFWQLYYRTWRMYPNKMYLSHEQNKQNAITRTFYPIERVTEKELQAIIKQKRMEREGKSIMTNLKTKKKMKQFFDSMTPRDKVLWKLAKKERRTMGTRNQSPMTTKEIFEELKKEAERENQNITM